MSLASVSPCSCSLHPSHPPPAPDTASSAPAPDIHLPDLDLWEDLRQECQDLTNGRVEMIFHHGKIVRLEIHKIRLAADIAAASARRADDAAGGLLGGQESVNPTGA